MADRQSNETEAASIVTRRVLWRTGVVIGGYLVYATLAMTMPSNHEDAGPQGPPDVLNPGGLGVWLGNNCQSCHSLYGLGGHTGPDLTNVTARRLPGYVQAVVRTGLPGMPPFNIGESEADELAIFLDQVSATGVYPPKSLGSPVFGEQW